MKHVTCVHARLIVIVEVVLLSLLLSNMHCARCSGKKSSFDLKQSWVQILALLLINGITLVKIT